MQGRKTLKLKALGEFKLIDRIREQASEGEGVDRGIGDDAAVLNLPEGHQLLTSTDLLIEGVHFRHDWTDCEALGHKAVAVNLSDIAAMGGSPRYLYLGLACPDEAEMLFYVASTTKLRNTVSPWSVAIPAEAPARG
jgi:thiamine-monophosphate kinase